jgi:Mrp family chromosome partitioning ATPase
LLARACDGLVIVAQSEVTHREALQLAAERARVVGCRTLGVVMHATKAPIPRWMRRVFVEERRTHTDPEE